MPRSRSLALAGAVLLTCAPVGLAEVAGRTTVEQTLVPSGDAFKLLSEGPGEAYTARTEGIGSAQAGREDRRLSLLYFGQVTDFQLADEESPARVEFVDPAGPPVDAAWRPMEALTPHTVDAAIRQVNAFVRQSPLADSSGARAKMTFGLMTGDNADNQQRNETEWVVRLIEGGALTPNSGVEPTPVYTGVSDYDDYDPDDTNYYDPDSPQGMWATFPEYDGLLDRAQQSFQADGIDVPLYATFGNHDALVQGNEAANASFEAIATGPLKIFGNTAAPVPPDPARAFVDKSEYKALFKTAASPDAHGFGLVEPAQEAASMGAAGYYAFRPAPGFRFIAVDTVCEGGVAGPSADGNVDDPQFQWLEGQLRAATARDELVFLFSHHAIASLTCSVPDEAAGPCGVNPGCDLDPRDSQPIHLGADLTELVHRYPHVVAWIAGHTHANSIEAFRAAGREGGFWSIRLASEIDWPQQSRLLEVMDNRDGTLSIFGTILNQAAPAGIPTSGTSASSFTPITLASISRALAANDPQLGVGTGEGEKKDRNVELLVRDPRENPLDPTARAGSGRRCASLRGRIRGRRVHRAVLGRARRAIRRAYPSRSRKGRFDVFCLADGKRVRVGYKRGRASVILTSSRHFRVRGIRPGAKRSRLRGRARRLTGGFYTARARRATIVFRVIRGRVREVGLTKKTRTRAAAKKLLR